MTVNEMKKAAKKHWMSRPDNEKWFGGYFSDGKVSCEMSFTNSGTGLRADSARYSFRIMRDGNWKVISAKKLQDIIG